jgi:hypothetical protein
MPEPMWPYLTALLSFATVATWLARASGRETASHDPLTRLRKGRWSGHTRLDVALRALFTGMGGELLSDDPMVDFPLDKERSPNQSIEPRRYTVRLMPQ